MNRLRLRSVALWWSAFLALPHPASLAAQPEAGEAGIVPAEDRIELGRRMYEQGILPSGETMEALVRGDIRLTGEQVVCGACHRRSGMGASEGQDIVPAVTGDLLYSPLRLPTSRPPLAPERRPAYTDETLKRSIRDGIGAAGEPFSPLMPRYPLSDEELDILVDYMKTLASISAAGVTDKEIHFATIVSDNLAPETRKAFLDVFEAYFQQKNVETRNESSRAEHAPWHKAWVFGPYRKWVLHPWELKGPQASWPEQLAVQYRQQPVFAVLSGLVGGSWKPIHEFCGGAQVPCIFPVTDLPVIDEQDFYSVYLSEGMMLEAETIARNLADDKLLDEVVQVYRDGDSMGMAAAAGLRNAVQARGGNVSELRLSEAAGDPGGDLWSSVLGRGQNTAVILWLGKSDVETYWGRVDMNAWPARVYLSTSLYGVDAEGVPPAIRDRVLFVHPYELPEKLDRLLRRATGWLRAKRIYAPTERRVQADAFFALKMAGAAVKGIQGYFNQEYFVEQLEHMVDNASYTSVYPRVSLAPGQRFVAKGCYLARVSGDGIGRLEPVTEWRAP